MSVGQWVLDGDNIVEVVVYDTSPEQCPKRTDEMGRHSGEVGKGFAADPLSPPSMISGGGLPVVMSGLESCPGPCPAPCYMATSSLLIDIHGERCNRKNNCMATIIQDSKWLDPARCRMTREDGLIQTGEMGWKSRSEVCYPKYNTY